MATNDIDYSSFITEDMTDDEINSIFETIHQLPVQQQQIQPPVRQHIQPPVQQPNQNELIGHLWDLAYETFQPMITSRCSVYIALKLNGKNIKCLLDTGAEDNIISKKLINELNLESMIDIRVHGNAIGVGVNKIEGIIPYVELEMENGVGCPVSLSVMNISLLNSEIILGLPFMMFYNVVLNFEKRTASIMGHNFNLIVIDR